MTEVSVFAQLATCRRVLSTMGTKGMLGQMQNLTEKFFYFSIVKNVQGPPWGCGDWSDGHMRLIHSPFLSGF